MKYLSWASVTPHVKFIKYVQNLSPSHCFTAFTMVQATITFLWMTVVAAYLVSLFLLLPSSKIFTQHRTILLHVRFLTLLLRTLQWLVDALQDGTPATWDFLPFTFAHSSHTCSLNGPPDSRHSLVWGFFTGHSLVPWLIPSSFSNFCWKFTFS